jgi:hypothetical protein
MNKKNCTNISMYSQQKEILDHHKHYYQLAKGEDVVVVGLRK